MNQIAKRLVALVAMTGVVLGTTAGVKNATDARYRTIPSDAPLVMTINGTQIKADEYASYMVYNMRYMEQQYAQYGMTGLWEDEQSAQMIGASLPSAAKDQALYTHVVMGKAAELGIKLSGAQQSNIKNARKDMIAQAGGVEGFQQFIATFGFNEALYNNFMVVNESYSALGEYYYGENGIEKVSDEDVLKYLSDNYLQAKHILIGTADPMTGEAMRTDAEALAEAQKVIDRLNAGEDFDAVMNEVSEDTGLQQNPDGYIFAEGDMVTEFYEGAKALGEGAVSDPIKSDFGYHIIKRIPVDASAQLENYRPMVLSKMEKTMDVQVTKWMEEAEVTTEPLYDQITYQNVYDYAPVAKVDTAAPAQ